MPKKLFFGEMSNAFKGIIAVSAFIYFIIMIFIFLHFSSSSSVPEKPSSNYKNDSGIKYGDIYGFDTNQDKFADKKTIDECAQACNDTTDCKSFVFASDLKTCWGKTINDLTKSYPQPNRVLYYK